MSQGLSLDHDWFPRPLPPNVELGERSWCYSSFAFLHCQSRRPRAVRLGHDTGVYHGTFFDLGPEGEVEIGDYCTLVGAIICTNGRIVIGSYTFIAHEVVLADRFAAAPWRAAPPPVAVPPGAGESGQRLRQEAWDSQRPSLRENISEGRVTRVPNSTPARSVSGVAKTSNEVIVIGENCWIGARAVLLAGARLGEGVIVGAAAVVDFPVPAYAVVAGNPARIVGHAPPSASI